MAEQRQVQPQAMLFGDAPHADWVVVGVVSTDQHLAVRAKGQGIDDSLLDFDNVEDLILWYRLEAQLSTETTGRQQPSILA